MWYIVQPNDSIYLIAKRFNTAPQKIIQANRLPGTAIYVGQPLNIRAEKEIIYTVQQDDSLYGIAQLYNTIAKSIIALNNLASTALYIGQKLLIPQYTEVQVNVNIANIRNGPGINYNIIATMVKDAKLPVEKYQPGWYLVRLYNGNKAWVAEANVTLHVYSGDKPIQGIVAFYTLSEGPGLPSSYNSFVNNTGNISELGLFLYQISRDDPTQIDKFGDFTDRDIETLVSIAHKNNIKILPVVHNLLYKPGGTTLAKSLIKQLVSTDENRKSFAQSILKLIQRYNFDGVNIDIEDVNIEDKQNLSLLYEEIANTIKPYGYFFSASVPARIGDEPFNPFSDPFDYDSIGSSVDQFVVMLYNEFGWPGSPPGPPVTIGWMERVLKYTMTKMPKEKIVAAVSVFGFDFNLTTGKNSYASFDRAMELANKYNKEIIFDEKTKTPMFSYEDEEGNKHEVWFENAQSIKAKIDLAWQLGISGVALWRLGLEDPDIWTMLSNDVVVKKF